MGFSVQSIEYMLNGAEQDSGSRALGETGGKHYWTRIKIKTDASGCSSVFFSLDGNCRNGAQSNVPYGQGAQLTVSTSATPSSYVGGTANITGTYLGNNQQYWRFSGSVSVSLKANTSYYLFLRPCWTTTDYFVQSVTGAIAVSSKANWPSYALSISAGPGSTATVRRTASELGAAIEDLSDGATIYKGDTLEVGFSASAGYELGTHTVNGTTRASGYSFTVSAAVTVKATAAKKTYTLSISAGTGASVTVKRGTTTLSDGATITHGDELSVTFEASTGYDLATHTVNGTTRASGYSFTVSGAVTVKATAERRTFTLTVTATPGALVTVKRGSETLHNGSAIYAGDKLTISFAASTGYKLIGHMVNSASFPSGNTHTVGSNVTVSSAAEVLSYTLTVTAGTGSSATVTRTASPLKDAATGALTNGATVYYGDKLTISFSASTGYELKTHTVGGAEFASGGSHTVAGAVTVKAAANVKSFALSISPATGTTVTVQRTSSPKQGAATGTLADGAKVYYSDVLKVTFAAKTGYVLDGGTVNGETFTSGNSHTVTKAVTVKTTGHAGPSTISSLTPTSVQTQQTLALSVSRVSTAYYHKARFYAGNTLLATSDAFAKDLSYTVPRAWFTNAPNSTSMTVTVSVQTYTTSECTTAVGSPATKTVTVTADSGMKPTLQSGFASVAADNSDISYSGTGTLSVYVQGRSKAAVTLVKSKITNAAGATVASYKVTCQGKTTTKDSPGATETMTTAALTGTADIPITVTVTDSRGRTASTTLTVTPFAYAKPTLSGVKVFRCDSGGVKLDGGAYFSVTATAGVSSLGGKNKVASLTSRRYSADKSRSWDSMSLTSGVTRKLGGTLVENDSYIIRITVTDQLGSTSYTEVTLPGLRWAVKFRANGQGVGFGMAPSRDKVLQIPEDWDVLVGQLGLVYRAGDSVSLPYANRAQFAASFRGTNALLFTIPLPKPIASGVTAAVSGSILIIGNGSYRSLNLGDSSVSSVVVHTSECGISVVVSFSPVPSYFSTQTLIGVMANGLTITFN